MRFATLVCAAKRDVSDLTLHAKTRILKVSTIAGQTQDRPQFSLDHPGIWTLAALMKVVNNPTARPVDSLGPDAERQALDLSAYQGCWVALIGATVAGVGRTREEASLAAKLSRHRERLTNVVFVAETSILPGR